MPVVVDLASNASVKLITVDQDNTACAYMANLYIPIFTLDTGKLLRRFEVSNQIVGLHFSTTKKNSFYAIDDSFGLHVFDTRSDSKKKFRLNPEVENHNVVCTAMSSAGILAVSSSEFGGGILDVRGSRHREHHPHIISFFDIRYPTEPITSYKKKHTSEIGVMEYYKNGTDLLTGSVSGALKSFDTKLRDEDNALRWERYTRGPVTKVGIINKRIVYSVSNYSEGNVFVDSKGNLEVLYGSVNETADEPIVKTSKAFYKKPEFCVGLIKGVNDELPLIAVHGVENENFLSLTAMNQYGTRQEKPMLTYRGHTGQVKCMTATPELLLTGGEDGKVVIQIANVKNAKFGEDAIDHHPLTLNRGKLAELHDRGEDKPLEPVKEDDDAGADADQDSDSDSDETDSDSDDSDEDVPSSSNAGPSSSASFAAPSSSSSSSQPGPSSSSDAPKPKRPPLSAPTFGIYTKKKTDVPVKRKRKEVITPPGTPSRAQFRVDEDIPAVMRREGLKELAKLKKAQEEAEEKKAKKAAEKEAREKEEKKAAQKEEEEKKVKKGGEKTKEKEAKKGGEKEAEEKKAKKTGEKEGDEKKAKKAGEKEAEEKKAKKAGEKEAEEKKAKKAEKEKDSKKAGSSSATDKDAKEKAARKAEKEKALRKAEQEREERKQMKRNETEEQRAERKRQEKKERERLEQESQEKEKEKDDRKRRLGEGSSASTSTGPSNPKKKQK